VVINKIHQDTIFQHSQCGIDLLDGAMTKLSAAFLLCSKNPSNFVTHSQICSNNLIQILKWHQKTLFGESGIVHGVSPHQLVGPFDPLPPQLLPFENGATVLETLVRVQTKIMAISSSSEKSHSSSELES
jgi:hypothetical protein